MEGSHLKEGTLLQGGKYRIVRFISSGGFGCTYEAVHVMLGERMAIKEFFPQQFCNRDSATSRISVSADGNRKIVEKARRKFLEEARALYQMKHTDIVRVSDIFEENGTAYYTMEYIDGKSLGKILKEQGPLPEQKALRYIRQVAKALEYVHSQNRLHLDIKPDNIMIDTKDNALLIDFGASKHYDDETGESPSTLVGRTPGYAPPEQMGNNVKKFLPATDIYSLGATLYKLLTGATPLSATDRSGGDSLAPLPSYISKNTVDAVTAAMRLNKMERPQSIAEFLKILDGGKAVKPVKVVDVKEEETEINKEVEVVAVSAPLDNGVKTNNGTTPKNDVSVGESENAGEGIDEWLAEDERQKSRKKKISIVAASIVAFIVIIVCVIIYNQQPHQTQVSEASGTINGYEYVDLDLSVKWARYNVGATSPSGYGDYFAWGETKTKSEYTEENSETYGKEMGDISGDARYDAARANWGSTWRLPTAEEIDELKNKCKWKWAKIGNYVGWKVTGPNGNSIFLPAAGYRYGSSLYYQGSYGNFWSSTPYEGSTDRACYLYFGSGSFLRGWYYRRHGFSVRPVSE